MSYDAISSGSGPRKPERPRHNVADILAEGLAAEAPTPAAAPAAPAKSSDQHVVQYGETAASIARRYGVSLSNLKAWNPHIFTDQADGKGRVRNLSGARIYPGDVIMLRPPTSGDSATLERAAAEHAKKAIERAANRSGVHDPADAPSLAEQLAKAEAALKLIPKDHPDRARCEEMVNEMRKELQQVEPPAKPPVPTAEEKAIQDAKIALDTAPADMAKAGDRAKGEAILKAAQDNLAKIPAKDSLHGHYEELVANLKTTLDARFPLEKPIDPKVAKMRKELDSYLDQLSKPRRNDPDQPDTTPSRWTSVAALVKAQPEVVAAATPDQKARIVGLLLGRRSDDLVSLIGGGSMNNEGKRATLDVIRSAAQQGQLESVLDTLKTQDKLDGLFNQMSDSYQGVEMARTFKDAKIYESPKGYYKAMDDDATCALLKASGYVDPPPPTLTSDYLGSLPKEAKDHMMKELTSGNVTWEESRMAQWLGRQVPPEKQ